MTKTPAHGRTVDDILRAELQHTRDTIRNTTLRINGARQLIAEQEEKLTGLVATQARLEAALAREEDQA